MILYQSITGQIQCAKLGTDENPVLVWREWPESGEPGPWQVVDSLAAINRSFAPSLTAPMKAHWRARCMHHCWEQRENSTFRMAPKSDGIRRQISALEAEEKGS